MGISRLQPTETAFNSPKISGEFTPKLVTTLREGYRLNDLRADIFAGLTVAIVALPLSMAIAIASGVGPERGLFTTIIGGFLVSALGGSRFQIGGPAGAFIVLVSACVGEIGVEGLLLATLLSGIMLSGLALVRAGSYVRYIPHPVTLGFTAGIAVIILASQIKDMFGLSLTGAEPSDILHKLPVLWQAMDSINPVTAGVSIASVVGILALRRWFSRLPGLLITVALAALVVAVFHLPVETIHSRFGTLPSLPPAPGLPELGHVGLFPSLQLAFPWALSFTLLGAIESLLSAVVADGMSGRRHRPNAELLAQGLANIVTPLFGGFCVTGTIARTATNVRAGSRGPVSGMFHALFVLGFLLVAAPLAGFIPLAALAAVLVVVAWNMIERHEISHLLRWSRAEALVVLVTFLLVVFRDLTEGIVLGTALAGLFFVNGMSVATAITFEDVPPLDGKPQPKIICHLKGPWFFAAAARLGPTLDQLAERSADIEIDLSLVTLMDSSGAAALAQLFRKMDRKGGKLIFRDANDSVLTALRQAGLGSAQMSPQGRN